MNTYSKVKVEVPIEQPATQPGEASPEDSTTAKPPAAQTETVERVHIPIDRAKALLLEEVKASNQKSEPAPNT